jgi:hypothetical protein
MIAETVRDLLVLMLPLPFLKYKEDKSEYLNKIKLAKEKWAFIGARFEAILVNNGSKFLVGLGMTYADVLVVHVLTW